MTEQHQHLAQLKITDEDGTEFLLLDSCDWTNGKPHPRQFNRLGLKVSIGSQCKNWDLNLYFNREHEDRLYAFLEARRQARAASSEDNPPSE